MSPHRVMAAAVLLAACSEDPQGVPRQRCLSDLECGTCEVCFNGECRKLDATLQKVDVHVKPSQSSGYLAQGFRDLDLSRGNTLDLTLDLPVTVKGSVLKEGTTGGTLPVYPARVVFTAAPDAPGLSSHVSRAVEQFDGSFEVKLLPHTYDVAVLPENAGENQPGDPPAYFPSRALQGNVEGLDLRLPPDTRIMQIRGRILSGGAPQGGVAVTAMTTSLDTAVEPQPLSQTGLTRASDGYLYRLNLARPATSCLPLRLAIGPRDSQHLFPLIARGPSFCAAETLQLEDFELGALGTPATVTGRVVGEDGAPIGGARVRYSGSGPQASWTLAREATTDAEGKYTLEVLPASYLVSATPPTGSKFGISALTAVRVAAAAVQAEDVVAPEKAALLAQVLTPQGAPAADVEVRVLRRPDGFTPSKTEQTLTGPDGRFALMLDQGTWQIELLPLPSSGLPRRVLEVEMGLQDREIETPIELFKPFELLGTARASQPGGAPALALAGARIEVYSLDIGRTEPVRIGEALTDDVGRWRAIVPNVVGPAPGACK